MMRTLVRNKISNRLCLVVAVGSALLTATSGMACWGPTCGDVFHPSDKWDVPSPSVPTAGEIADHAINALGLAVGRDQTVVAAATNGGWTKDNCVEEGTLVSTSVAAVYSAAVCTALGVGLGTGPCLAAVAGSGAALTAVACTQLCNDHNLRSESCGNP
jgi:hypothetical protein